MDYFNGLMEVDVSNIDCLNDMTQDMANAIATGPQDNFFQLLDGFNSELSHQGIEAIDVTNKWNWKPGTSKKIVEFQTNRLQLKKTHGGITKQFDRTRERANYLSYIRNQAERLERLKYELKQAGVTKDVDIAEFQQKAIDLTRIITDQCSLVNDLTEGKVIMTPYMSTNFESRKTPFYLDIKLSELTMSIYNGDKEIQQIPLDTIHLIFQYPFRHYINGFSTNWRNLGCYGEFKNIQMFKFPYIGSLEHRYRTDGAMAYGNVCLDRFNEDIKKAFLNKDFIQMSMHLMNWAQYYSTTHSNPYNKTQWLHLGLPKGYSTEYKATISSVQTDCSNRISYEIPWEHGNDIVQHSRDITTPCVDIECQLILSCSHFKRHRDRMFHIETLTDKYCQIESLLGMIVDTLESHDTWTWTDYNQVLENCGLGYYDFREMTRVLENINGIATKMPMNKQNDIWLDCLISEMLMYWLDHRGYDELFDIVMFYEASRSSESTSYFDLGYPKEEVKVPLDEDVDIEHDDEEMRKMMLEWATNPGRSRR